MFSCWFTCCTLGASGISCPSLPRLRFCLLPRPSYCMMRLLKPLPFFAKEKRLESVKSQSETYLSCSHTTGVDPSTPRICLVSTAIPADFDFSASLLLLLLSPVCRRCVDRVRWVLYKRSHAQDSGLHSCLVSLACTQGNLGLSWQLVDRWSWQKVTASVVPCELARPFVTKPSFCWPLCLEGAEGVLPSVMAKLDLLW